MTTELITMGVSTLGGFALKYMSTQAYYRHQQMMDLMGAQERADKVEGGQGKYVRRFIVLVMMSLFAFIIIGPAFLDINTILVDEGWLWTTTTEIKGIIYDNTIREILVAIIGFYFGTSAASR